MTNTIRKCIACRREMGQDDHNIVNGGVEFLAHPGYGSGFDSVLTEPTTWKGLPIVRPPGCYKNRSLSIVLCDECLGEAEADILVSHEQSIQEVSTHRTKWADSEFPKLWREHKDQAGNDDSS